MMSIQFKYLVYTIIGSLSFSINMAHAKPILETQPAKIIQNDPSFEDLIGNNPQLELLDTDTVWAEGPQAMPDGSFIWSDVKGNRAFRWDNKNGTQTLLNPSQHQNGHAVDQEGRIIAASHGKRGIERLESDGQWHILVDLYKDNKLNSPNDVIVDHDGDIWFTDPDFGIIQPSEGYGGTPLQGGNFVYRYSPKTNKITRLDTPTVKAPNGLAFSPDEKVIYITDTDIAYGLINNHLKDIHTNHQIDAYDVNADKSLSNGHLFTQVSPGFPDGIKVDEKGNVWSSSKNGVQVFNPKGKKIGEVTFPQTVSNLSFGFNPETKKPVLFVTSTHNIYRLTVNVAGAAAHELQ